MRRAALLLCLTLLAGCTQSPQSQFFVLSEVPSAQPVRSVQGAPVVVGDVTIPNYLDRPELVVRQGKDRLDISGTDRWGAPLDGMIRDILRQDLTDRLPKGMLLLEPGPESAATSRVVQVQIDDFAADPAGKVTLDALWAVVQQDPAKTTLQRRESIHVNAGAGPAAQADGMSRALGRLADHIADALAGQTGTAKPGT